MKRIMSHSEKKVVKQISKLNKYTYLGTKLDTKKCPNA